MVATRRATDPKGISGLAFSFGGDLSGTYRAAGTPVVGGDGQPEFGSWAIAAEADSLGGLVLAAFCPSEDAVLASVGFF